MPRVKLTDAEFRVRAFMWDEVEAVPSVCALLVGEELQTVWSLRAAAWCFRGASADGSGDLRRHQPRALGHHSGQVFFQPRGKQGVILLPLLHGWKSLVIIKQSVELQVEM